LEAWKLAAFLKPNSCIICGKPGKRYQIVMQDFRGGAKEPDGEFEAPVCDKHFKAGIVATQAILTERARRS